MKEETKTAEEILTHHFLKNHDRKVDKKSLNQVELDAMEEYASIKTKELESENTRLTEALEEILNVDEYEIRDKYISMREIAEQALKKTT